MGASTSNIFEIISLACRNKYHGMTTGNTLAIRTHRGPRGFSAVLGSRNWIVVAVRAETGSAASVQTKKCLMITPEITVTSSFNLTRLAQDPSMPWGSCCMHCNALFFRPAVDLYRIRVAGQTETHSQLFAEPTILPLDSVGGSCIVKARLYKVSIRPIV